MKFSTVTTLCILAILTSAANPSYATYVSLTNPNQFAPGSTLITFDEGDFNGHFLAPFEVLTSYRGIGFAALGTTPTTNVAVGYAPNSTREFGPGGMAYGTVIHSGSVFQPDPLQGLQITLPGPVNQLGGEFIAVTAGNLTFALFAGNQQVDLVTLPISHVEASAYFFHAFQSSISFDRVIIRGPGATDGRVELENLRFGGLAAPATPATVPEPSTFSLLGLSVAARGLRRRRHAV